MAVLKSPAKSWRKWTDNNAWLSKDGSVTVREGAPKTECFPHTDHVKEQDENKPVQQYPTKRLWKQCRHQFEKMYKVSKKVHSGVGGEALEQEEQ